MKLLVIGLMVVGNLFIGASIQAQEGSQEDLREQYLDARDEATEAVGAARNE